MRRKRKAVVIGKVCGYRKQKIKSKDLSNADIPTSLAANLCALIKAMPTKRTKANFQPGPG